MGLQALKIIDEEFDRAAAQIDPCRTNNTLDILLECEKRIKDRIEKELVEIPESFDEIVCTGDATRGGV